MAAVPELASEMVYYSGNENDMLFEVDGPKQMQCCFQDLDLSSQGDDNIQLQISHQLYKKKFRQVVSIIVTVEKLRHMLVPDSQFSQNDDLKSLFHIIFEEEPIICDTWDDDHYVYDAPPKIINCRIQDRDQKCLVLSGSHQLYALHLRRDALDQQVVFSMSNVQGEESGEKIPVALGLKDKNLYLSCIMKDEKPTLHLEVVDPKIYPKKKMEKRFIFNKTEVKGVFEFESAQFPSWYISTSQAEEKPVFLANIRGGQDITNFSIEILSP
ncbi:interleukin-1 beta [Erinaceus europaeus]|uniref:Multifunctional fusion protein n=1 Tax=Erinaceus europaeus TaxID=9365 RepID=A0A1S2ZW37_ERIEU|nr:interleukin-1 beta [Erinaceus europaeus]